MAALIQSWFNLKKVQHHIHIETLECDVISWYDSEADQQPATSAITAPSQGEINAIADRQKLNKRNKIFNQIIANIWDSGPEI